MHDLQTARSHIMLVGYNRASRLSLSGMLEDEGYRVSAFEDLRLAMDNVAYLQPQAIVTDFIRLGQVDTHALIRRYARHVPVVVLSYHDALMDVVRCLRSGASDYIRYPSHFPEILARIERVMASPPDQTVAAGAVILTLATGEATIGHDIVQLTRCETRVLDAIIGAQGRPVSRSEIMEQAGIDGARPEVVESYVKQIRRKHPYLREAVRTYYRRGYAFRPCSA